MNSKKRMNTNNLLPEYHLVTATLAQQEIGMTAAEMHGLICGILCGGKSDDRWQGLLYDLTNEGRVFAPPLAQQIQMLYDTTHQALQADVINLPLLLPIASINNEDSLFDLADAVKAWVFHFLLGIALRGTELDKATGEVGEAFHDLREITRLGYDQSDDRQELQLALQEIIGYVQVAAILCYVELARAGVQTKRQRGDITLH